MGWKIPPTKKSSTPSNASDVSTSANNILTRLTATKKELLKRVANLKKIVEKLQSELYVTKNGNTLLNNETDDLQQYQKRYCITIDGLCTSPSETSNQVTEKAEKVLTENLQFNPEEVNYQIDKCHRIGPINTKDSMQSTIVRFKTHSFREAVYLKKENATKNKKSNFPSHKKEEKLSNMLTTMLTSYLKLTSSMLTYTVTLNFVLKILSTYEPNWTSEPIWEVWVGLGQFWCWIGRQVDQWQWRTRLTLNVLKILKSKWK